MRCRVLAAVGVLLLAGTATLQANDNDGDPWSVPLPPGWRVASDAPVPGDAVARIARHLGVRVSGQHVRHLDVNGARVKLNLLTAPDESQAKALHRALARIRGGLFIRRDGVHVAEIAVGSPIFAKRVWAALGRLDLPPQAWTGTFRLAPLPAPHGRHDAIAANVLFNRALAVAKAPEDGDALRALQDHVKDWTWGRTLTLAGPATRYTFTPAPTRATADRRRTRFVWADALPRWHGIPHVDVAIRVTTEDRYVPRPDDEDPGSTEATLHWPAKDTALAAVATRITKDAATDRARVQAILRHLADVLPSAGPRGSRHGVARALALRQGHCWDRSDALVTFCRAVGIPARQVAGWVPVLKAGHVWCEVRLREEGWIPVDATTPWLGVSSDYVPLFRTEDGVMPIAHLAWPDLSSTPVPPR